MSEEEATVTYSVEPGSGYALIQGSSLLAYDAGTVEVTAHMTYLDQTVDSEALTFTIAKNTAVKKKIVSFEEVTVYTKKGSHRRCRRRSGHIMIPDTRGIWTLHGIVYMQNSWNSLEKS